MLDTNKELKIYKQIFEDKGISISQYNKEENSIIVSFPEIWHSKFKYIFDENNKIKMRERFYEH